MLISRDDLALMLSKSRTEAGQTQKYMAKAMDRSVGTIQNWESGYATPNLIETLQWFEVLGINPLRYLLDAVYPDIYQGLTQEDDDKEVDVALHHYLDEVAPISEKRKMAYCIFGNTGSSWQAQVEMITAHNHTTVRSRVNAARTIYDSYKMEKARGELIGTDHIMPDEDKLSTAIENGINSVFDGKKGYVK